MPVSEMLEAPESTELPRVELFGVPFHRVTFSQVRDCVDRRVRDGKPGFIVTPNIDHVCQFQDNEAFRVAYGKAFLSLVDSMPLVWMSRLLGQPLPEKLSGSDLVPLLCRSAAESGHSVFLFGAAEGVADEAAKRLQRANPQLRVAGTYSPPLRFEEDPRENEKALDAVRQAAPDLLFVALGSPRQELWLAGHYEDLRVPVSIGVGAGLDFAAGRTRRAPLWMRRAALEWFWRLMMEPRRLWRRYLIEDSKFFLLFFRELRRIAGRRGSRAGR